MKVGSDRRASADHNNFTKNKVRQGESEGWITGLGLQPRLSYLLLQSKQNEEKSAETVGRRGSIQLSLLSTPTSQRGHRSDPASPTTIPNAWNPRNSSIIRAQSQILIRVPGKSTQYLGRRPTTIVEVEGCVISARARSRGTRRSHQ